MLASPQPPIPAASRLRRLILVIALLSVLGGVIFLATRHRPVTPAPLAEVEVHRRSLELRDGKWYAPGQTNGFTGLLIDTYDDGAMKSRSSLSNGLMEGLSVGWHTNGQQQVEEHFQAGVSHGLRTKWHENGRMLSTVIIEDGQLEGTFTRWHPDGSLAEQVELKQGQPDGLSRAYYSSGFLKAEVRLHQGKVLKQTFWKDGEHRETQVVASGLVTSNDH